MINLINKFDISKKPFDEHEIGAAISSFIKEENPVKLPTEWLAEALAFDFSARYRRSDSGWPSLAQVSAEIIEYWTTRAQEAKNPILKLRYADLVWDYSKTVTGNAPHFSLGQLIIDSTIRITAGDGHKYKSEVIEKLDRALSLALSMNDQVRVEQVRDSIIAYEKKIAIDRQQGLWGFSYDLILAGGKKVPITDPIKETILQELEQRLCRVCNVHDDTNLDHWAAEQAALRLATYYRRVDRQEDVRRVLLKLGEAVEAYAANAGAFLGSTWLQELYLIYQKFNLKSEVERIAVKLREIGPNVRNGLQRISSEVTMTTEEVKNYIDSVVAGDLETTLQNIALHHIPSKSQAENLLHELANNAPLTHSMPRQILDPEGRHIATVNPLQSDPDGNIVFSIARDLSFSSFFLRSIMETCIAKFSLTSEGMTSFLYQSPAYAESKRAIIQEGLRAYLENNHIAAVHLLVPQIEAAVRKLVEGSGTSVLKGRPDGGFNLKLLDELLREQAMARCFGEDALLYFRVVLTDQRGWNIRNNTCHGIVPASEFQAAVADRIIHILLCLALVRKREDEATASKENEEQAEQSHGAD